jgi:hypothetical protein
MRFIRRTLAYAIKFDPNTSLVHGTEQDLDRFGLTFAKIVRLRLKGFDPAHL